MKLAATLISLSGNDNIYLVRGFNHWLYPYVTGILTKQPSVQTIRREEKMAATSAARRLSMSSAALVLAVLVSAALGQQVTNNTIYIYSFTTTPVIYTLHIHSTTLYIYY